MAAALTYQPARKWPTVSAFASAVLIHLAAVGLAELKSEPAKLNFVEPDSVIVAVAEFSEPPSPPVEVPEVVPPPPPPMAAEEDIIPEDRPPPPVPRSSAPPIRLPPSNTAPRVAPGVANVRATSAPRPEYPYEARRQRLTGSGVATLTIDPATGIVTRVTMAQSTGSAVLDNATTSGLRRWRFKPGTAATIQTPITYTLTGASY